MNGRKPRYRNSNRHALERAQLRYGVSLTDEDLAAMVDLIQKGDARYSGVDWPTNSYWYLDYKGETYRVVYNGREKRICTFLPMSHMPHPKEEREAAVG